MDKTEKEKEFKTLLLKEAIAAVSVFLSDNKYQGHVGIVLFEEKPKKPKQFEACFVTDTTEEMFLEIMAKLILKLRKTTQLPKNGPVNCN